jgi:hypothetical protein
MKKRFVLLMVALGVIYLIAVSKDSSNIANTLPVEPLGITKIN